MTDEKLFYQSINKTMVYDENFFKKVYGYSVCNELFLTAVAARLIDIGQKDIIQVYNE